MELLATPRLSHLERHRRPPEMARLPLHRLRVRREGREVTLHGYVVARLADGMIVQLSDRQGTPNRHVAEVHAESVIEDAAAEHQPTETPARVLALRAYVQDELDHLALERA